MSASLRKFRALIGHYVDVSVEPGIEVAEYAVDPSPDVDGMWWCSVSQPTGREVTVGMRPEHRIDVILGFAAHAPVEVPGASRVAGVLYLHRAILNRDYGRDEVQVYAEKSLDAFTISDGTYS